MILATCYAVMRLRDERKDFARLTLDHRTIATVSALDQLSTC